jgi:hypothetical protein
MGPLLGVRLTHLASVLAGDQGQCRQELQEPALETTCWEIHRSSEPMVASARRARASGF